jgi:hypothetical protein
MDRRMPWPKSYIEGSLPSPVELSGLSATLASASDEAPLQRFLATSPRILRSLLPSTSDAWLFDRPELGSEFIPDFLLAYRNSLGYNWVLVELESPRQPPLTKRGRPGAKLNEALAQIRDWRTWLRENISYARDTLGFRGIHAEVPAYVLIGRRIHLDNKDLPRYRELSLSTGANIMSYDRLLDTPTLSTIGA